MRCVRAIEDDEDGQLLKDIITTDIWYVHGEPGVVVDIEIHEDWGYTYWRRS